MAVNLHNKPIIITGAGTGIGKATALACAQAGMPVALAGRRVEPLEAVAQEIDAKGGRAMVVPTDVADAQACKDLVARTIETFGSLYSVFANAGYGLRGPVHKLSDTDIHAIFQTNFFGSLNVLRPAIAYLLEHHKPPSLPVGTKAGLPVAPVGHLMMCSSCLSKIGTPYTAPYSASKALQDHFGRAMRHELGPMGIAVSTVHPIGTRTPFFETAAKHSIDASRNLPSPRLLTQPPQRVAAAIVACLHKPKGEVWTSLTVRTALAVAAAMPRTADRLIAYKLAGKHRSTT